MTVRIAISGTYGTGKSTRAMHLAQTSGLPLVSAKGMRAFLRDHFGSRKLEDCTFDDLIELGLRRFRERVVAEASHPTGFISDGSTLNEWAYGLGRAKYGSALDNNEPIPIDAAQNTFTRVMERLGKVFREHAGRGCDLIIHLPPELALAADQHRPLMPAYRTFTDDCLYRAYADLGLPIQECVGSVQQREVEAMQAIERLRVPGAFLVQRHE